MKIQRSKEFYLKWMSNNHLTVSDMNRYLNRYYGISLLRHQVIDYLIDNNLSASDLRYITSNY